jgi:poly(hydroxyalkanoate) depolymerase family esterase
VISRFALWLAPIYLLEMRAPNGKQNTTNPAANSAAGHFVDGTVTSGADSRRWRLWVPSGYDAGTRYPLLVLLHGCTQDPDDIARGTRISEHADKLGVLVLLPEQPESANPKKCWSWYDAAHQRRDIGEPSLIAGATRQVLAEWSVDAQRVYVAGISAGAAMASVVAITYADMYAAAGLHSGIPYRAAANVMEGVAAMSNGATDPNALATLALSEMGARARPIPAIIVQGAADVVVKPLNAEHTGRMWLAMNAAARGASSHESASPVETTRQANGLRVSESCYRGGGPSGTCEVKMLLVDGLGHAWSGGSKAGTFTDERGPDATDEMLRFLLAHRLTEPNERRR